MANALDMTGAVTIRSSDLAPVNPILRLVEALRSETVDFISVENSRISIKIDTLKQVRPGGDKWLFLIWEQGQFEVIDRGNTVCVRFELRVDEAAILLPLVFLVVALFCWVAASPVAFIFFGFVAIVITCILWIRYVSLPRWLRRVLTSPDLPTPKRLKTRTEAG